jgi:DNA-binding transcriptional regulator YiaG
MTPKRITKIRESLGHTQAQFADFIGVSRVWLNKLEAGHAEPRQQLVMLLQALEDGWRPK